MTDRLEGRSAEQRVPVPHCPKVGDRPPSAALAVPKSSKPSGLTSYASHRNEVVAVMPRSQRWRMRVLACDRTAAAAGWRFECRRCRASVMAILDFSSRPIVVRCDCRGATVGIGGQWYSNLLILRLLGSQAFRGLGASLACSLCPVRGLDVWSRPLMGHPYRVIRRMRYGPGSARERHDD
jgi:hypothetical protein